MRESTEAVERARRAESTAVGERAEAVESADSYERSLTGGVYRVQGASRID